MFDLNRVTVLGRLTRDPEARATARGMSVANITIATKRVWTDQAGVRQEKSEFHNCVLWGKLADLASQYLRKASRVYADGRLETRDWTDQTGVKRYRTEIIVENIILLDPKGAYASAPATTASGEVPPIPAAFDAPPAQMAAPAQPAEEEIKVEDIPF